MSQTLKEKYQQKRIIEVQSKLKKIDNQILESNVDFQVHLLMEALDENEYREATEVIEKLTKLNDIAKSAGMNLLSGALDKVVKEINNFTGGSGLSRFKGKMSSLFSKTPTKNPILAGLAVVGALESGFKILPTVLKNNIPDIEKDAAKQKQKLEDLTSDEKVKKNIENNLIKAFVPSGTFGKIFGKIPGINSTADLIADIFMATPLQLGEFSKVLNAGVTVQNIDADLANPKEAGSAQGDKQTEKPAPEQQKKNIQVTQDAAKKAGISDGKALLSLFDELGYKLGSFEGSLVVPELQKLQRKYNIPDDQTDGFTRGLMVDFEKDFKAKLQDQIKKEVERLKKEQEKSGTEKAAAPATGAGSQLGGALGAG
jgi:hypothetical protein